MRIVDEVRHKLDEGLLPRTKPHTVWAGYGRGECCCVCDQELLPTQLVYDFDADGQTYRFHINCYDLWTGELALLSECATSLLAFFRSIGGSSTCEACAATHLGVGPYEALKAIRELVLAGRVLCSFQECSVCFQRRLCATIRERPRPLTEPSRDL